MMVILRWGRLGSALITWGCRLLVLLGSVVGGARSSSEYEAILKYSTHRGRLGDEYHVS